MNITIEDIKLLKETRRTLHAHPELSGHEYKTQERITSFLNERTNAKFKKIGKSGILAEYGTESDNSTVLIRADIDALPIQEINEFSHASKFAGISHKCGHDGHTTILLGLAKMLSENPLNSGKIFLLFQPSEENGKGAKSVLDDSEFPKEKIDYVFALHNLPGITKKSIIVKNEEFTCHVKSCVIHLKGKTTHAAEPEHGHNPALAIANILRYADHRTRNKPEEKDFFLVTPIHVTMGEVAYGVSAGAGEVHLTIRSRSTELMKAETEKLEDFIKDEANKYNIKSSIHWLEEFYANINDPEAVNLIKGAAKEMDLELTEKSSPFKWGEDFGLFTQRFSGAMFGIGAGENSPALHNPDYDYPDDITATAIEVFYRILKNIYTT